MRIAKYLLLILLLLSFALFVFIATQPNGFSVTAKGTIATSKLQTFEYVNNLSTWEKWWIPFDEKSKTLQIDVSKITYNHSTIEKIASFENDSIELFITDVDFNGSSILSFNPIDKKKTEVLWKINGEVSFKTKFLAFFKGGMQNVLESKMQESFQNIENEMQKTFLDYSITLNGFETKNGLTYIAIVDSINKGDFDEKRKQNFKRIDAFIKKQNLTKNGDPFVIFYIDSIHYLSCIPIAKELDSITVDSSMTKGKFDSYLALKTTLKGNYSYRNTAWEEAKKSLKKSNYKEKKDGLYIEVYKNESKQTPANNITEIYIPVRKPVIVNEPKKDSLQPTETRKDSL